MRHKLSLHKFQDLEAMLYMLKRLDLTGDMTIMWEKKPQLTINQLGNFEFTNPEEVYGVIISFWKSTNEFSETRFYISESK